MLNMFMPKGQNLIGLRDFRREVYAINFYLDKFLKKFNTTKQGIKMTL